MIAVKKTSTKYFEVKCEQQRLWPYRVDFEAKFYLSARTLGILKHESASTERNLYNLGELQRPTSTFAFVHSYQSDQYPHCSWQHLILCKWIRNNLKWNSMHYGLCEVIVLKKGLTDWLNDRRKDLLTRRLTGYLIYKLIDWLIDWLIDRSIDYW